jgi:hypothetical protein
MAFKVGDFTVIDNNRELSAITSFDRTVTSVWDQITTTAVSKTLVNREHCVITSSTGITLPNNPAPSPGYQCAVTKLGDFSATVFSGYPIMGVGPDFATPDGTYLEIDVPNVTLVFTYIDTPTGWVIS